jgi:hypothetical protein
MHQVHQVNARHARQTNIRNQTAGLSQVCGIGFDVYDVLFGIGVDFAGMVLGR